jgi:transcriptional regulator with XRE-family HTH domain
MGIQIEKDGALAESIRRKRESLGMNLVDVDEITGINRGSLSRMERGEQRITVNDLRRLAKAYKCTVDDLLPDNDPPRRLRRREIEEEETTHA